MPSLNKKALEYCFTIFVLTVFGYIREFEHALRLRIPLLINYLCIKYYNDGDHFDSTHCCDRVQILNYEATQKHGILYNRYADWLVNNIDSTCWLRNVITEGKYGWVFQIKIKSINKIIDDYRDSMSQFYLGIYDASDENWQSIQNLSTKCLFDNFGTSYLMGIRTLDAIQYTNNEPIIIGPTRILPAQFDCGEYNIRMVLDMNQLTLTMHNDELKQTIQFEIKPGRYVAGVIVGHSSYSIKLIKSSYIYTDK